MPNAKAVRVAGAGHGVSREQAAFFNTTVLAFFGRILDALNWLLRSAQMRGYLAHNLDMNILKTALFIRQGKS